jgi:flagellar hook-basal body complex protein FliE
MEPPPTHDPSDPAIQRQRDVYRQVVELLRGTLPASANEPAEAVASRLNAAIAEVASMVPANGQEAKLAAYAVAAGAHFADCLARALEDPSNPQRVAQCRAQAASMGREARGFNAMLLRMQAARIKRESKDDTREAAAWTEHGAIGLMTREIADHQAREAAIEAAKPPPPPPVPPEEAEHRTNLDREASRYAVVHTMRAQSIRKHRGKPPDCDFELPRPELMDAIIHGTGSNLRWCDEYVPWVPKDPPPNDRREHTAP